MKKMPIIFSIILSLTAYFAGNSVVYANTVAITGSISATVLTALSLSLPTQQMSFGSFLPPSSEKTITISSDSVATGSTNTTIVATGIIASNCLVGIIPVTGEPSTNYQYGIGAANSSDNGSNHEATITIADSASHSMSVALNIKSIAASGSLGSLSNTGSGNLIIGGVLTVNASQASGSYSGSYSVSVNYQ